MINEIADSKVKLRLLQIFKKKDSYYVSEAAREAGVSKSRASQCLRDLSGKGVLFSRNVGRNVVYSLSPTVLAKESISFLDIEERLLNKIYKDFIKEAKKIKPTSIAVFGSSIHGIKIGSDIDFFVVSGKRDPFYEISGKLTEKFGIKISALVMEEEELKRKVRGGEEFVINILANHKLIYGRKLEDLIWQEK